MASRMTTKCYEGKPDCFAFDFESGKCRCLADTNFKAKDCPFYKPRRQLLKENPDYYVVYGKKGIK